MLINKDETIKKLEILLNSGKITQLEFDTLLKKTNSNISPKPSNSKSNTFEVDWKKVLVLGLLLISIFLVIYYLVKPENQTAKNELIETSTLLEDELEISENKENIVSDSNKNTETLDKTDNTEMETSPLTNKSLNDNQENNISIKEESTTKQNSAKGILEFNTYNNLSGISKVSYFINNVISLRYKQDLSVSQNVEYKLILQDSFDVFYNNLQSMEQTIICEYLMTFKSEFKIYQLIIDKEKYNKIKTLGDC